MTTSEDLTTRLRNDAGHPNCDPSASALEREAADRIDRSKLAALEREREIGKLLARIEKLEAELASFHRVTIPDVTAWQTDLYLKRGSDDHQ